MPILLSPLESRVIACLIEKEITTPEQYPLSLNALVNACNQKSNRDPLLDLDEASVQQTLDALVRKFLVSNQTGYGSRVSKYQHRFCNSEFGKLQFSARELAIICELMLRGPQTPGELRSRASRLSPFDDSAEVEAVLQALATREDGPFVVRLLRETGKREARYAQLFCGEVAEVDHSELPRAATESARSGSAGRMAELEARVATLEADVALLKQFVAEFQ